jgi:hypothetical protein
MTGFSAFSRQRPFLGIEPMEDRRLLAAQVITSSGSTPLSLAQLEGGHAAYLTDTSGGGSFTFTFRSVGQSHLALASVVSSTTFHRLIDLAKSIAYDDMAVESASAGSVIISPAPASTSSEGGTVPAPPGGLGGPTAFRHLEAAAVVAVTQPTRPVVRSEMARCVVIHVADRPVHQRPPSDLAAVVNGKPAAASRLVGRTSVAPAAPQQPLPTADLRGVESSGRKAVVRSAQASVPKPQAPVALVAMKTTSAVGTSALMPTPATAASTPETTANRAEPPGDEASLTPPPEPHETRWWIRLVATPAAAMIAVSGAWYVARASGDRRPDSRPMLRVKGLARIRESAAS